MKNSEEAPNISTMKTDAVLPDSGTVSNTTHQYSVPAHLVKHPSRGIHAIIYADSPYALTIITMNGYRADREIRVRDLSERVYLLNQTL